MPDLDTSIRRLLEDRAAAVAAPADPPPALMRRARMRRLRTGSGAGLLAAALLLGSSVAHGRASGDKTTTDLATQPPTTVETTTTATEPSTTTPWVATSTTIREATPTSAPQPRSAPTSAAVTTTVPRTTTTGRPIPPVPDDALWPPPGSATTFRTPEQATSDFASRFLGIGRPEPGRARVTGDGATVEIRAMVVTLRRVGSRGWVVVGCAAPTIVVDEPTAGTTIGSPLTVRGRSSTWEGHVDVEVRRDASTAPIGRSFGTGGGMRAHCPSKPRSPSPHPPTHGAPWW